MITGNMARDNFYQPGSLIFMDDADCDGTADPQFAIGGYAIIINPTGNTMQVSYTPPCNCIPLVMLHANYYHSANNAAVGLRAYCNGIIDKRASGVTGTAGWSYDFMVVGYGSIMTKGTAYSFEGHYYTGSNNIFVTRSPIYTYLQVMFFRAP